MMASPTLSFYAAKVLQRMNPFQMLRNMASIPRAHDTITGEHRLGTPGPFFFSIADRQ